MGGEGGERWEAGQRSKRIIVASCSAGTPLKTKDMGEGVEGEVV